MYIFQIKRLITTLAALLMFFAAVYAQAGTPPVINDNLMPFCWGVKTSTTLSPDQVGKLAGKFGAKAETIENIKIDAAGIPLQVNIVYCPTGGDATRTYQYFSGLGQPDWKYVRAGNRVYEFMCSNTMVVAKMKSLLGILEIGSRKWSVEFEVAPLERSHDDMKWNSFFNAAAANRRNSEDEDTILEILDLSPSFEYSNKLSIRNEKTPWGAPRYEFTPNAAGRSVVGDRLIAGFDVLPKTVEVPRVKIDAVVCTQSFGTYQPDNMTDDYKHALLRATDPWPLAHGEVRRVLAECYELEWTPRRNLESILCWVYHNIEYKGDVVGSRYGTLKVLEQRYGHCWDKTDVFITMCRMVRIPSRQIYGWRNGVGGHVWAQVYLDDEGWISVDPTCSWLGVTDDYIPLFISEDGHPPFVYTDFPKITPMD